MIWLPILLAIFMLSLIPFCIKANVNYDLTNNEGGLNFYFAPIKVVSKNFFLMPQGIVIQGKNKNSLTPYFNLGKSGVGDSFALCLIKSAKINTVKADLLLGVNDCMVTAMLCGHLLVIEKILMSILSNKRNIDVKRCVVEPCYTHGTFGFSCSFSMSINLLLIMISFVSAIFNIKRSVLVYGE